MSKQVKEAKEKHEGRELLEQSNLKHLTFKFSFVVMLTYFDHGSNPTVGIRARIPKKNVIPYKVSEGEVTMIKSEKEETVTLQCPLLTKSNYVWLINDVF